jgi:predicted DsbA family dithiol-disulfide isomerase
MRIQMTYASDVLCIWAFVAEARLEELRGEFGAQVELDYRFIPVFGATHHRIGEGWKDRGGYASFGEHVREVAAGFPHVALGDGLWTDVRPTTSATAHEILCAVRLLQAEGSLDAGRPADGGRTTFEEAIWQVRCAFFQHGRDISRREVVLDVVQKAGVSRDAVEDKLGSGAALAGLCRDIELRDRRKIEGSPTFYLNQGRQKLYGNVGYRVISANVRELLERPPGQASWC